MRKALLPALVALAISMLVLTSCASSNKERTLSEDECRYTLDLVFRQANDSAVPEMFIAMNELDDSMVMSEYSFLNDLRHTIPGMDRLLMLWELAVSSSVIPSFDLFSSYLTTMADEVVYPNPVQMIESGTDSISLFILADKGDSMALVIRDHLLNLDVSPWREVAVQYNSWASTREKLYGEQAPRIDADMDSKEIIALLSHRLVEIYISYLRKEEMMIRTTPNADMDPVAARVLGLD
ncbi:MAG: hypothetical protein IKS77_05340 [Spirochaetales bacterium]|nr:hypothetical protein [Spirochaetales bacterium]